MIWSVGPNALTGGTSVHEAQNPNPNNAGSADRIFVSRTRSEPSAAEYDDLVHWIPGATVAGRMRVAGMMTPSGSGVGRTGGGGGTYGAGGGGGEED